jgi:hypothetical protein
MKIGQRFRRLANKSPRELVQAVRASARYRAMVWRLRIPRIGNNRTGYVLGLFGTGRWYINEQILQNIGERAKYFKDEICFHPRPTSMIYSSHVTKNYISRGFAQPVGMIRILEAVRLGFADLVFCLSSSLGLSAHKLGVLAGDRPRRANGCWRFPGL